MRAGHHALGRDLSQRVVGTHSSRVTSSIVWATRQPAERRGHGSAEQAAGRARLATRSGSSYRLTVPRPPCLACRYASALPACPGCGRRTLPAGGNTDNWALRVLVGILAAAIASEALVLLLG